MKKFFVKLFIFSLFFPLLASAETASIKLTDTKIINGKNTATIYWKNPIDSSFKETIIFRSIIPIEEYFDYNAVESLCDIVYKGQDENFTDIGLTVNLKYYYILFVSDKNENYSNATVLEKKVLNNKEIEEPKNNDKIKKETSSLSGASSDIVNTVTLNEAGTIYSYNQKIETPKNKETSRLSLFIIVKSPHALTDNDKNSISYFIDQGTPTTILLGAGERAGVLNSYLSVFNKLPKNTLEWQDIIKIANGRWPDERNTEWEEKTQEEFFSTIYKRQPDINNPNDNAAVMVITYGLRPITRNLESEKAAINIYRSIFKKTPSNAGDWDLVRAIAYSGAIR